MKIKCEPQNGRAKTAGRLRRLTTEQVLETAIAIGLEGLTMSAVARPRRQHNRALWLCF